jgi:uncharacterized damage-inducible protein DinB
MDSFERKDAPFIASEKEALLGFLDYQRATLLMKIQGVSDEDLRRPAIAPSTMTLLGLVKHLAYVERWWFQAAFAGLEVSFIWSKEDPDADWRVEPDETTEQIIDLYKAEILKSREIATTAALQDVSKGKSRNQFNFCWMVLHMIEETARHCGHADLLREVIDGVAGM